MSRTLVLVRHAKAEAYGPSDAERALTERGHAEAHEAGRWLAARGKLNLATVLDFATSNDVVGGNSGSPAIARDGSVIGALFDGNIHSLGGAFGYDPALNRSVVVSAAAVEAALKTVYPAPALVAELHAD